MTTAKITLLTAAALWSSGTFAAELAHPASRIEERFALSSTEKHDCTGSLHWREHCRSQNVTTPSFGPAITTLSATPVVSLMHEAFAQTHRSLLARFIQK